MLPDAERGRGAERTFLVIHNLSQGEPALEIASVRTSDPRFSAQVDAGGERVRWTALNGDRYEALPIRVILSKEAPPGLIEAQLSLETNLEGALTLPVRCRVK
jgi:hypothetical protein